MLLVVHGVDCVHVHWLLWVEGVPEVWLVDLAMGALVREEVALVGGLGAFFVVHSEISWWTLMSATDASTTNAVS